MIGLGCHIMFRKQANVSYAGCVVDRVCSEIVLYFAFINKT